MSTRRPLAIAVGDPAGVGPEVALQAASGLGDDHAVLFGDARRLAARALELGIDRSLVRWEDAGAVSDAAIAARAPTAEGGAAQLRALALATQAVRSGAARALVTGPVSKEAVALAGHAFTGQTEWLAAADGRLPDDVTMLFLGPSLCVGLVTTHLAIRDVPAALTAVRVSRTCVHLGEALVQLGRLPSPDEVGPRGAPPGASVHVTGLNPHAGEGGLFGDEESRAIAPGIVDARAREPYASGRLTLVGPRPAESVFREAQHRRVAGVVAMFHDQATIASKLCDWGDAVNVTWGLSFVRTSVDHGVAYDAARSGTAAATGMIAAVELARRLVPV